MTIEMAANALSTSTGPDDAAVRHSRLAVLSMARGNLIERCRVSADRLSEGWKPWSERDIDILIQLNKAITVLDKLVEENVQRGEAAEVGGQQGF